MGRPFKAKMFTVKCSSCLVVLSLKKCASCSAVKPRDSFSDNKNRPDGKYSYCKDCRADDHQAHREERNAVYMEHYRKNRDKFLKRFKEYRSNPENKKKIYAQNRAYYVRHFFLTRARELKSGVTALDLANLWKKQRGLCGLTNVRLDRKNAHLDHIVPRAKGGGNELQNLRWVTRDVNHAKRDMLDNDFFEMCRQVVAKQNKENLLGKHSLNDQYDHKGGLAYPQQTRGLSGVIQKSEPSLIGLEAEITILECNAPDANKAEPVQQDRERLSEKEPTY